MLVQMDRISALILLALSLAVMAILLGSRRLAQIANSPNVPGVYARVDQGFIHSGICELSDSPPDYCDDLTSRELELSGTCDTCGGVLRTGSLHHNDDRCGDCRELCVTTLPPFVRIYYLLGCECGFCNQKIQQLARKITPVQFPRMKSIPSRTIPFLVHKGASLSYKVEP